MSTDTETRTPDDLETPVEVIVNPDPKPGLRTTEFWVILAANLIVVALAMVEKIEASWAAGAVTVLSGIYAILRNLLKTRTVKEAGRSIFGFLLVAAAACLLLPGCGLHSADVVYTHDGWKVTYLNTPDGSNTVIYEETSTSRTYRAIRTDTGQWILEVQDPNTGLWARVQTDAKAPLELGVDAPAPPAA